MGFGSVVKYSLPSTGQIQIPNAYLNKQQQATQEQQRQAYENSIPQKYFSDGWLTVTKRLTGQNDLAKGNIPQVYLQNNSSPSGGLLSKFDAGASIPSVYQNKG